MEHKEEINSQLQWGISMKSDTGLDLKKDINKDIEILNSTTNLI